MTELQYLTALSTLRSEIGFLGSNCFTIWTAYLVGSKLPLVFSILVTLIYTTFLFGTATVLISATDAAYYVGENYRASYPDTPVLPISRGIAYAVLGTLIVSWVISVLFFWHQHRPKATAHDEGAAAVDG